MISTVGIGMPVYNGEKTIKRAIDSLRRQSYKNFKLIISDNASTDQTESICREYEKIDSRISYIKQSSNIGIGNNFKYVLNNSHEEYFMWAAADDCWSSNFLLFNLENLERVKGIIASISKSKYCSLYDINPGDHAILNKGIYARRMNYLQNPGINSRLYSIFRRSILEKIDIDKYMFIGADWALIYDLLEYGGFYRDDREVGFFKSENGLSRDKASIKLQARDRCIGYLIPLHRLTHHIIVNGGIIYLPLIIKHNIVYLLYSYPLVHKFLRYLKYSFKNGL